MKNFIFLPLLILSLFPKWASSQIDNKAFELLNETLEPLFKSDGFTITFSSIRNGRGIPFMDSEMVDFDQTKGEIQISKDKYLLDFGILKSMSDGELVVFVNELDATMVVDSVGRFPDGNDKSNFFSEPQKEGILSMKLEEILFEGRRYKSVISKDRNKVNEDLELEIVSYFLFDQEGKWRYWVEFNPKEKTFVRYTIGGVKIDSEISKLKVHFPSEEVSEFRGYSVFDNRFIK